jgi:hypothetical protein
MDRKLTIDTGDGQGSKKRGYPPSPPGWGGMGRKWELNRIEHAEIAQLLDMKGETATWQENF